MKNLLLILSAIIWLFSCAENTIENDFVTVNGNQFVKNGEQYCFLGTNVWYGANLGAEDNGGQRERLIRELDQLKALGIDNLRILGAAEGVTQDNTVNPPIQPKLNIYNENILKGLDFMLAEMAKRDMVAVIYLNNYWIWSGGMSQYVAWHENKKIPNPFHEDHSWDEFMKFSATFYSNEEANKSFRKYLKFLVYRTNTITGKKYKEDPTIMSWQLANEPRPGRGEAGKKNFPAFAKWINETAKYIKSLDNNHLVSTGNEGLAGCMESEELYKKIHNFNSIDYMNMHLWVLNWRWFDPLKAEETYPGAMKNVYDYIDKHIKFAAEIGKPLVMEEFGIPRDLHSYDPGATTQYRDKYFNSVFELIYQNAKNKGPLVGSNFWAWGGEGRPANLPESAWKAGDDFTGDPPQEPQGRNSVFSSDSTTLNILSIYADKMNKIGK